MIWRSFVSPPTSTWWEISTGRPLRTGKSVNFLTLTYQSGVQWAWINRLDVAERAITQDEGLGPAEGLCGHFCTSFSFFFFYFCLSLPGSSVNSNRLETQRSRSAEQKRCLTKGPDMSAFWDWRDLLTQLSPLTFQPQPGLFFQLWWMTYQSKSGVFLKGCSIYLRSSLYMHLCCPTKPKLPLTRTMKLSQEFVSDQKKKKSCLHSAISQFVVILWELWNRQCCWNPIKFMFLSDSTYMIWLALLQFLLGKHHDCSQPSCPRRQFGCRVTSQVSVCSSTLVFFIIRCSAFTIASV